MTWYMTLSVGLGIMIAFLFSGLPVFIAFLTITAVGAFIAFGPAAYGLVVNSLQASLTSQSLVAIPLFLLMGEVLSRSGAVDELYEALERLIARTKIRLYLLGISLSTVLGTMSGSAMADAALLGKTVYPGMVERGYDKRMSCGLLLSGATLAPIIPPSILAIILATLAQLSIAELLVAGLLPGLMLASLFIIYIAVRVKLDPSKAPSVDDELADLPGSARFFAFLRLLPFGTVIFMVIGLILLGIASPTEAAATGVVGALAVSFYLRSLSLSMIATALFSTARTAAIIMVIIMSANLFGQLLSYTGAPEAVVHMVALLDISPWWIFVALLGLAFVSCMFLGAIEFMLISVPVYAPIIAHIGFEPIWFWMIYLVTITTGGMTPPFGMTMFVFKASAPELPISEIYKSTLPYIGIICIGLVILSIFPEITLFIPGLMR